MLNSHTAKPTPTLQNSPFIFVFLIAYFLKVKAKNQKAVCCHRTRHQEQTKAKIRHTKPLICFFLHLINSVLLTPFRQGTSHRRKE